MKDLVSHILDIVQNSIEAHATLVSLTISYQTETSRLTFIVTDNGKGIEHEKLHNITHPFSTSRKSRKVGMGLALLQQNTQACGGSLTISSQPGIGTTVCAVFNRSHIDCLPLGNLASVLALLITANSQIDFEIHLASSLQDFTVTSTDLREALSPLALNDPSVYSYLVDFFASNLSNIMV